MNVLLVIDMLNDFLEEDGALDCGPSARAIVPFVREQVALFRAHKRPVVFVADAHDPDDAEFERFPPHCVRGTRGARILDGLAEPGDAVVEKTRYSGFFDTDLESRLRTYRDLACDDELRVHVVGVCTNICVLYTVEELRNRDIPTVVHARGVAAFDQEAHRFALAQMKDVLGASVV